VIEVKLRETKVDAKTGPHSIYDLVVDGDVVDNTRVTIYPYKENQETSRVLRVSVYEAKVSDRILEHRFSDLPSEVDSFSVNPSFFLIPEEEIFHDVIISRLENPDQFIIYMQFYFNFGNWKRLWSITEYSQEFIRNAKQGDNSILKADATSEGGPEDGFSIIFPVENTDSIIKAEVLKHEEELRNLHELTEMSLASRLRNESVVMYFDFPEQVRVSCEQYLLYFVQFLKDLEVEATAELQHEAGQVLFAVTPTDEKDALDKIRTALEAYLSLPASKLTDEDKDIIMQRLAGNIYHLKSQLALSQAMLQTKDATIEAQQLTIATQRLVLRGDIFFESLKDVTPKPKDKEELLGGTVAIKKYDGKFVEVDLPELYRKLKRMFEKKD
jgi:hypothetical protein